MSGTGKTCPEEFKREAVQWWRRLATGLRLLVSLELI
jgi:hypothetical protein